MIKQPSLPSELPAGFEILRGWLTAAEQRETIKECRDLCRRFPLYTPRNQYAELNVRVNSFGEFGWFADERGFRYLTEHPYRFCGSCRRWFHTENGECRVCRTRLFKRKFPTVPEVVRRKMHEAAQRCAAALRLETVLLNYYAPGKGRLGKHRDDTEANWQAPIITLSLGDDCLFGIGGRTYGEPLQYLTLSSGDCVVMSGESRLLYHEVAEVFNGTSKLLDGGGRISLTGRQVRL